MILDKTIGSIWAEFRCLKLPKTQFLLSRERGQSQFWFTSPRYRKWPKLQSSYFLHCAVFTAVTILPLHWSIFVIMIYVSVCVGAALVCRAETPLGGISFNCPRKYAPFNEKDEDVLCCGSKVNRWINWVMLFRLNSNHVACDSDWYRWTNML